MYIADVTMTTKMWVYEINFRVGDESLLKCKQEINTSIIELGKKLHLTDTIEVEYTIYLREDAEEDYIEHEEYRGKYKNTDYEDFVVLYD